MTNDYVPMLIVSVNKDGEYIHIRKANNEEEYKCPCCGAKIKARAMESEKVQPHFYHSEGSECSKENIAHWIYKNWLFNNGCKFIISKDGINEEYQVDSIDIEKSYNTKFGLYKPDITVTTSCGKIIYFEINYSNKKDVDDYLCKWNELENDVIEVNIRELINADLNHTTPVFSVIYSGGDYLKKYESKSKDDVYRNTIKRYKEAIVRSDCENYKKRFEQLDWFWILLQKYRLEKISQSEIVDNFCLLEFEDMCNCYKLVKRLKCVNLNDIFANIVNKSFNFQIDNTKQFLLTNTIIENIDINIEQESTQIFNCSVNISTCFDKYEKGNRFRIYNELFNYDIYTSILIDVDLLLNKAIEYHTAYNKNMINISSFCEENNKYTYKIKKDGNIVFLRNGENAFSRAILSCDSVGLLKFVDQHEQYLKSQIIYDIIRNKEHKIINILRKTEKLLGKELGCITSLKLYLYNCNNMHIEVSIGVNSYIIDLIKISDDEIKNIEKFVYDKTYTDFLKVYQIFNNIKDNFVFIKDLINNCKNKVWYSKLEVFTNKIVFIILLRAENDFNTYSTEIIYTINDIIRNNDINVKDDVAKEMNRLLCGNNYRFLFNEEVQANA